MHICTKLGHKNIISVVHNFESVNFVPGLDIEVKSRH